MYRNFEKYDNNNGYKITVHNQKLRFFELISLYSN